MYGQHDVSTPEAYFASLEEPRKSEIIRIDAFIRESVPDLEPCIVYKILGYGPVQIVNGRGKVEQSARIALANNKASISLYVMGKRDGNYIAEAHAASLPKAQVGKSCIRFKRLSDLDPTVLRDILVLAETADYSCQ